MLGILLGPALAAQQGIPLAPPLHTRLVALVVVEVMLITTAVLLYVRWAQLKGQPLDEWWAGRVAAGFSPRTRALMEESERERLAAEGAAPAAEGAAPAGAAAPPDAAPPQTPPQT